MLDLPHIQAKQIFPALFEIRKNVYMTVYLDVVKNDDNIQLICAAGIRTYKDSLLPLGGTLLIKHRDISPPPPNTPNEDINQTVYIAKITDTGKLGHFPIHTLAFNHKPEPPFYRQGSRFPMEREGRREHSQVQFVTRNLSRAGLQFTFTSTLTASLLNKPLPIELKLNSEWHSFTCTPHYIIYNWWDGEHKVGASFHNLTSDQTTFLDQFLPMEEEPKAPPPEPETSEDPTNSEDEGGPNNSKKTRIDPESGRIRFDK